MNEERRALWRRRDSIVAIALCMIVVALFLSPLLNLSLYPRHSGGVRCISRLHEIGLGIQMYAYDHGGELPSSAIVTHSSKWSRRACIAFCTRLSGRQPEAAGMPPSYARALYPYYIKSSRLLFCADDSARTVEENSTVSYWWKCAIDRAWFGDGCAKPRRRIADYPHPQRTIVVYEHEVWHGSSTGPLRPGAKIPVLCLDGSASGVTLSNTTSGDRINCAANTDGEPMYFNYDNKTKTRCAGPATYIDPARYSDELAGISN